MERELPALAHCTEEDQDAGNGDSGRVNRAGFDGREGRLHVKGAGLEEQQCKADEETHVPHPGGDEGLLGCLGVCPLRVPEPDQQERTEADKFPADVHQQEVVREDDAEHCRREERLDGEEPPVAVVSLHVSRCVELDQERQERDNAKHHD